MTNTPDIVPIIIGESLSCEFPGSVEQVFPGEGHGRDTLLDLIRQSARRDKGGVSPRVAAPILVGTREQCLGLSALIAPADADATVIEECISRGALLSATLGCLAAVRHDVKSIVLVAEANCTLPDHAVSDALAAAAWDAELDFIVTLGLTPGSACTSRSYITPGTVDYGNTHAVSSFHCAPDSETAAQLIGSGSLWTSGIYLFRATTFLSEVEMRIPEVFTAAKSCWNSALVFGGWFMIDREAAAACPSLSLAEALIGRSPRVTVLPVKACDRDALPARDLGRATDPTDATGSFQADDEARQETAIASLEASGNAGVESSA